MKVSVLIPVYNEARTISDLLERVSLAPLPAGVEKEIVVVNDCSTDATGNILSSLREKLDFTLVDHDSNRGKGAALRSGIPYCTGSVILFQDSDLEYAPEDYPQLIEPLLDDGIDVVYGSRFQNGRPKFMRFDFYLANRFLTWLSNLTTGLRLTDMETGYKAFRRDFLRRLTLRENAFGIEPEITAKMAKMLSNGSSRICEVGVTYSPRNYAGGKKVGFLDGIAAILCIFRYGLRQSALRPATEPLDSVQHQDADPV